MCGCLTSKPSKTNIKILPVSEPTPINKQQPQVKQHYVPKASKQRILETVTIKKSVDKEGKKMLNNYIFIKSLGSGAFAKVKLAIKMINDQEKKFAIKIFKKSMLKKKREFFKDSNGVMKQKDALDNVKKEIAIMKKLNHENVIKLFEVIENQESDKLFLVIEYAEGGQLIEWDEDDNKFFYINESQNEPLSEDFLRKMFRQCICGLYYLHSHGIIHRDIKPQNILFDEKGQAKLADFGVSFSYNNVDDQLCTTEGTYQFMAPESLNLNASKNGFSGKLADIWSLGITFYCFTFLELPFCEKNMLELIKAIQTKEMKIPDTRQTSEGLLEFIKLMLEKDPTKRSSLEQLAENKWINENSISLSEEMKVNKLEEVTNQEIQGALSVSTIVKLRTMVQRWRNNSTNTNPNNKQLTYIPENVNSQSMRDKEKRSSTQQIEKSIEDNQQQNQETKNNENEK